MERHANHGSTQVVDTYLTPTEGLMHLSDMTVRGLPFLKKGQKDYADDAVAGLSLRVGMSTKTFMLLLGSGKERKRQKLGNYPNLSLQQARKQARILVGRHQDRRSELPTVLFDDALRTYLKSYAAKTRPTTLYDTTRYFARFLEPTYTGKKLAGIKKAKLVAILDDIESVSVRRHFYAAAYTFFRWARRYDLPNPLDGVERPPKSPSRARSFTDQEFVTIWQASLECGAYGLLYRVLLVSGQRRKQIANLRSDFIDRSKRVITWPAHLMKTNKDFLFPYGDLLHSLLPQGEGLLFPAQDGGPWKTWEDPHLDLLKRCQLPHFTRHDCRRFYSSTHGAIGTQPHIRELLLSHAFGSEVSQVYDRHTWLNEKRTAQLAYEDHLTKLISPA